ncbi:hypothetical protein AMYX_01640 [Anaeromyxobacter diazotrophicus]|uniref:histidine kinase n=1 Tax=Anaeromyxobacter diazotrophicus TaxID=2590199 RepID=A0A7I9VGB1_9BACT|nr:hypothetical protein AMYX_01640 [Anaeromyxobacter diazotrophicus]
MATELERRQAVSLQVFALFGLTCTAGLECWRAVWGVHVLAATISNTLTMLALLAGVWAIRAGRFRLGAWIIASGSTLVLGAAIGASGLVYARDALKNLAIPLALAALVLGRRALWTALAAMLAFMALALGRDHHLLGGAGPRPNPSSEEVMFAVSAIVLVLLAIVLDRFGLTVLDAFADSESRRRQLEAATAERDRAALEQEQLRGQLLQAQKLESVGRLAGGIAHDFNNLLTVINACSDSLVAELPEGSALQGDAAEIRDAGARAAALTQQLLALSRQQVLEPRVLQLDGVVADARRLLQRVLGEDVELVISLGDAGRVRADPNQLHQVLMNLAVNARAAMPSGGRLVIETSPVEIDRPPAAGAAGPRPGRYARLRVTDTGTGMDAATRQRIFEPFFTTKPHGLGTGLGLSTVHGIVDQSGGCIAVVSEVGAGATFDIHLPRVEDAADPAPRAPASSPGSSRGGTILVVEDQAEVRRVTSRMLRAEGYQVLEAGGAEAALAAAAAHAGAIDLLVSDVVMPGTSGPALAERLAAVRPALRVLFVSGYAPEVVAHHGLLESGRGVLQKPFTAAALAEKVRAALADAPAGEERAGGRRAS